ncbi:Ig-like domain-containing protein [Ructibacterium gallinarum]|uniref:Galectin domain-containing protein n=1 Tax=Ructibacterium gallinarum TaxID=2779355 RepID=A0A9D5M035_9FIRM|nr:Ig-like domain-containing protein [Ructibacterium gallinarum]MBE5038993.1 hypothetical protein [Ructibacterium gallinarum]
MRRICMLLLALTLITGTLVVPVSAEPTNEWRMDSFSVEDAEAAYQNQYAFIELDEENNLRFRFEAQEGANEPWGIWARAPLKISQVAPGKFYEIEYRVKAENCPNNTLFGAIFGKTEKDASFTFHHYMNADGSVLACKTQQEWTTTYGKVNDLSRYFTVKYVVDMENASVNIFLDGTDMGSYAINGVTDPVKSLTEYMTFGEVKPQDFPAGGFSITLDYVSVKSSDAKPGEPLSDVWEQIDFTAGDGEAAYQGQYCMVDTDGDHNLRFTFKAKADEPMDTGIWAHAPLGVDKVESKNYYDIEYQVKVENPADNFLLGGLGLTAEGGQKGTFHHYVGADGKLSACISVSEWVSQYGGKISIGEFSKIRYVVDKKNASVEVWVNDIKQGTFYANQVSNAWDTISSYLNFGTQPPKKLNGDTVVTIDYIRVKSSDTKPEDPGSDKPRTWEKTNFTTADGEAAYQGQYCIVETDTEQNLKFRFTPEAGMGTGIWARAAMGFSEIQAGKYYEIEFRAKAENPQDTMLFGSFGTETTGGAGTFHHYLSKDGSLAACQKAADWTSNYGKIGDPAQFVTIKYLVDMDVDRVTVWADGINMGTYYQYQQTNPITRITDYLTFGGKAPKDITGEYSIIVDYIKITSMDELPEEELPTEWTNSTFTPAEGSYSAQPQGLVTATPQDGNLLIHFPTGSSSQVPYSRINFPEMAEGDIYTIEYRVKATGFPKEWVFGLLGGKAVTETGEEKNYSFHVYLKASGGALTACETPLSWLFGTFGTLKENEYTTIQYRVDMKAAAFEVFVNGESKGTYYTYGNKDAIKSINYLSFGGDKAQSTLEKDFDVTVDYVKVSVENKEEMRVTGNSLTEPERTSLTPQFDVEFSSDVAAKDLNSEKFKLMKKADGSPVPSGAYAVTGVEGSSKKARITVLEELELGTEYVLEISGVASSDAEIKPMQKPVQISFTTMSPDIVYATEGTAIAVNSEVTVRVKLKNTKVPAGEKEYACVVCLYQKDGNAMADMKVVEGVLASGATESVSQTLKMPEADSSKYEVRIFVWESMENGCPITDRKVVEIS